MMRTPGKAVVTVVLWGLCLGLASAQQAADPDNGWNSFAKPAKHTRPRKESDHSLNSDERLAVLASALDSKIPRLAEHDCSHLVHAIYERAGFPYSYASSDDLYDGVEGFQRVADPAPGDIVVWHGHAGIVVRPSKHVFFSFLHAGPGIDDYTSRYWRGRGEPRFYRYLKNSSCPGCTLAKGRAE